MDVEIADLALKFATIISPIDGIVTLVEAPNAGVNITPASFERVFDLDNVSYIYAKVDNVDFMPQAIRELENILLTQMDEEEFSVIDPKEFLSTVSSILAVITTGLAGIAAISLIVGGIGIANTMLVSVTERIREIGLRKAVGTTSKDILIQFLAEAAVLSIAGGIIGILLGSGGSYILNKFVRTQVTLWSIVFGFSVSVLTGIVSGIGPAIKAAKANPIDALRYE